MNKKLYILLILIVLPEILGFIYDALFRYSGNFLEVYQNYFKVGFLLTSIVGSIWLIVVSKKEKQYIWLAFSTVLLIVLLIYLYMGLVIINMSYGF